MCDGKCLRVWMCDRNADHVDDLHEREAEGELQRVALVDDGPL